MPGRAPGAATARKQNAMTLMPPIDDLVPLFDALPGVVFFAKDTACRYTHVNLTLVQRLGLKHRAELIGKTTAELYPSAMGQAYMAQDERVLAGEEIENQLEVHIFNNRSSGWCITLKRPLRVRGEICGLIGISRDLGVLDTRHPVYDKLRKVLDHMQAHFARKLPIPGLAKLAGLSVAQLERHFNHVFQLTPQQMLTKLRVDAAMRLLHGDQSVASVSLACGFVDQSAFDRKFKATTGITPRQYRKLIAPPQG